MSMQAIDIMTTTVVSAPQDAIIEDAVSLRLIRYVSALSVKDDQGRKSG